MEDTQLQWMEIERKGTKDDDYDDPKYNKH